jgi:hypothetical protein
MEDNDFGPKGSMHPPKWIITNPFNYVTASQFIMRAR